MKVSRSWKYEGFAADGEGILCISDMDHWKNDPDVRDPRGVTFEIGEGITDIEEGFFDLFPTLTRMIVPGSLKKIPVFGATLEMFRRNGVIITGEFDSYAEDFAREHGLNFIHSDILLGRSGSYYDHGSNIITLRFLLDGRAMIFQESFSSGISAGNNGGGEENITLKPDFYRTLSQNDIADMCWGCCYSKIRDNAELGRFLKKAKAKGGYSFWFGRTQNSSGKAPGEK